MLERLYTLKKYGLPIGAGVCLGTALLHPLLWPLIFVGGVLTIRVFTIAENAAQAARKGFVVGFVRSVIVLFWGFTIHPLEWLGIDAPVYQFVLICLYLLPTAAVLGGGMAFLGYMYRRLLHNRNNVWVSIASFGVLWVLAEVVGAVLFSIFMLGPGAALNANYSFGQSGYALVPHHLLFQFAAMLGVYSLSFVVGVLSMMLYRSFEGGWWWRYIFVLIILLSSVVPISTTYSSSTNATIAAIGTQFSFVHKELSSVEEEQDMLLDALAAAASTSAAYVLFPEDTNLLDSFANPESELSYLTTFSDTPRIYLDSARFDIGDETYMRAYVYDTRAGEVYSYDKQYLVPQGEYLPYVYSKLIDIFMHEGALVDRIREDSTYQPGIKQHTVSVPSYAPGVLFCFESVAPFGVYNSIRGRTGVPFVAHIVSHAWFLEPTTLWNQLDAMLLVQAKFNRVPIVQVANMAPLKVYYPDGRISYLDLVQNEPLWSVGILEL